VTPFVGDPKPSKENFWGLQKFIKNQEDN
jgi:hypothetical protein